LLLLCNLVTTPERELRRADALFAAATTSKDRGNSNVGKNHQENPWPWLMVNRQILGGRTIDRKPPNCQAKNGRVVT